MDERLAQAKVHARLHDPAEKALVLLRDPSGHEGGTIRTLHEELFARGVPDELRQWVKKADRWASAADRPQFPRQAGEGRYATWARVNFAEQPVLIHPLSGERFDLRKHGGLRDTDIGELKAQSLEHFRGLIQRGEDGEVDWWRTLLAFWRFGPRLTRSDDRIGLGELWRRLPADTRVPDHTIWDHLDIVSAFTGAFQADGEGRCALLNVSLGPVQEFIAAARTTSDLWAGSHLLSRLSWEAMRVVCEALGPDAILFPSLRGVPQVDLWLIECGLDRALFEGEAWFGSRLSDANPLFSAALPNRFLAVVPEDRAQALAADIEIGVRRWVREKAGEAATRLLEVAGLEADPANHVFRQLDAQLAGFPEVYWSVVAYDELVQAGGPGRETEFDPAPLARALTPFLGEDDGAPGFLGSAAWEVLRKPVEVEDPERNARAVFYRPNPGVLYPALYELGERVMAGAKSLKAFDALTQTGYRCSLTGESEWLTHEPEHLALPPGMRTDTLWARVAKARPAWARKGEHLGALAALKRLWPDLFCEEVRQLVELEDKPARFVVSTHTMALVPCLRKLAGEQASLADLDARVREEILAEPRAALPSRLARDLHGHRDAELIARLPSWLDSLKEQDRADEGRRTIKRILGAEPETYYALILMDGDRMGAWLSGDPELSISYIDSFHPAIRRVLQERFASDEALQAYLNAPRAVSPGRHIAISAALNDFSSTIARRVVESDFAGRILYAGGDDLMAMLPTVHLLGAMQCLREAYSGTYGRDEATGTPGRDRRGGGFELRDGRLHLCLGARATASIGAVVAHHQTPLQKVMAELRAAERRAKDEGGRNAFSITVLKRSGGALRLTDSWDTSAAGGVHGMTCLRELVESLSGESGGSRRAAYAVAGWLADLPEPEVLGGVSGLQGYLADMLHHQFLRQGIEREGQPPIHSRRLAQLCARETAAETRERLSHLLGIAEFLARETRR